MSTTINNTVIDGLSAQNKNLPSVGNATSNKILRTLHFLTSKVTSDILNAAYYGKGEISYTRDYIEKDLDLDLSTFITFLVSRGYDVYATDINNKYLNKENFENFMGAGFNIFKFGKIGYVLIKPNYTYESPGPSDPYYQYDGQTDCPNNQRYLPKFAYGNTTGNTNKYITLYDKKTSTNNDSHNLQFSYNSNNIVILNNYLDYIYYININFGETTIAPDEDVNKSPVVYSLVIE